MLTFACFYLFYPLLFCISYFCLNLLWDTISEKEVTKKANTFLVLFSLIMNLYMLHSDQKSKMFNECNESHFCLKCFIKLLYIIKQLTLVNYAENNHLFEEWTSVLMKLLLDDTPHQYNSAVIHAATTASVYWAKKGFQKSLNQWQGNR